MTPDANKLSPMMAQWQACKSQAKDAILLFRLGDFYEAFYDDAILASRLLELTLTKRQDVPMCGVPAHTCDAYIDKLVSKGHKVAVAEQTEDAKLAKGLVKREIVRVVTPGSVVNSTLLNDHTNNFFACVTRVGSIFGLAVVDLTTGECQVIEFENEKDLQNEIYRLRPSEFLVSKKFHEKHPEFVQDWRLSFRCLINVEEDWHFEHQTAHDFLIHHFKVHTLDGFGLKGMVTGINAAGALLAHLQDTLCQSIGHIRDIHTYTTSNYMTLDRISQRNLELTESQYDGSRKHTLLDILDKTCTPMGARLLRHWIKQPLLSVENIRARQDAVEAFFQSHHQLEKLAESLEYVRDLERLMMKMSSGHASPRDVLALKCSLEPIRGIKLLLKQLPSRLIQEEELCLVELPEVIGLIAHAIVDEPPLKVSDGKIFREGYHSELDGLRQISVNSKAWIASYQNRLKEETGIKTLKVGYTKVSGFYIEVSKGQSDKMPSTFQRRQTLVNGERYITPELKEYEEKFLHAEEKMLALEIELFGQLRNQIAAYSPQILPMAQALARIDCLRSLAAAARTLGYVRPLVDDSKVISIQEGRHPIIEAASFAQKFVPNDTFLDDENHRLLIITGPNMAGKSTYIRQVALMTIMAQIGSFIPAKSAHIGIVDKVFTRIGASDDLTRGQSTFMVEMTETANILNNVSDRSLVILDEIGRGTSTYDGISIAWSVAEYLLTCEGKTAKTLFATHYFELTKMEEKVPGAVNYTVAVHESNDDVVFLRKIVRGGTDKSYGIHVARLAGVPSSVISRAKELLIHLEENANRKSAFEPSQPKKVSQPKNRIPPSKEVQLTLF